MKPPSLFATLIVFFLTACGQKPAETPTPQTPAAAPSVFLSTGHPSVDAAKMAQTTAEPPLTQKAQVLSAIKITQYTYLEVMQDNKTRWLATTATTAKKGDTIQFR